jgi:hypothetical protein
MRLSMAVNKGNPIVATIAGPGYLDAHLNMGDRPKHDEDKKIVRLVGMETRETETVVLEWPSVDLKIGDVVELRVLPEGEGDEPTEIRRSSESPDNLFSTSEMANELVRTVSEFEERIGKLIEKSQQLEPSDEHKKFARAWGRVVWALGQSLLSPVYRRHKELIPDELKHELL